MDLQEANVLDISPETAYDTQLTWATNGGECIISISDLMGSCDPGFAVAFSQDQD